MSVKLGALQDCTLFSVSVNVVSTSYTGIYMCVKCTAIYLLWRHAKNRKIPTVIQVFLKEC